MVSVSSVKTCHMFLENIQKNIMRIMRINLGGSMIIHLSKYIDIHWNKITLYVPFLVPLP